MKKFSEILTETVLEKESKQEVDSIINEGIVDGFKKLATASKEKLSNFKNAFVSKTKDILSKTLGSLVKSLIESIQTKKTADVKSQMEENPLFKEFLSETNAINEISSDFDKNAVKSVIGKKGEVAAESIQYSNKNIISEDIADSVDTITTKIFSSVYNVISKVLEKIGYVIKPEFRNWYDRLVRKVQKKFYSTKLGQSIKDLPPEVEQDVMQKFQAIIGIVVIIVMIWIITSTLNGDSNEISTAATGGVAAEELDNAADMADPVDVSDARSDDFYNVEGTPTSDEISMAQIAKTDPDTYKAYNDYIKNRVAAIKEANPDMDTDDIAEAQKQATLEFKTALQKGKVLSVEDNKIIEANAESTDNTANNTKINSKNNDISDVTSNEADASTPKMYLKEGGFKGNIRYGNEPRELLDLRRQYIEERVDAISEANPKLSSQAIRIWKEKAQMEFDASFAHGKILNINDDGKIISLDKENVIQSLDNPKEYLKTAGALNGDTADLDVMQNLDDKYTASELANAGINTVKFEAYGVPVKIDISKLPDADKSLNPTQLAQKYVKEVAERAAKAKAEEEELGI